jgi:hypothetical protein
MFKLNSKFIFSEVIEDIINMLKIIIILYLVFYH